MTAPAEGLREQKKRATRAAIHRAALEIAQDEGVAAATVDRVAERAGVSPRTFFNYFATKESALAGINPDLPARLAAELLARPADESLADALRALVVGHLRTLTQDPELWRLRREVARDHPEIATTVLGSNNAVSHALAAAAYERVGADPATDPGPALTTFTAVGVLRAALWLYGERDFEGDVGDLAEGCFSHHRR